MTETILPQGAQSVDRTMRMTGRIDSRRRRAAVCGLAMLLAGAAVSAQVITINTSGNGPVIANGPVDRRFAQIEPTHVALPNTVLDPKTKLLLIRLLISEQGFAMRPLPRGHKGLTLVANGKLNPAGEAYLNMITNQGTAAKPGDRLVITDVKFDHTKLIFELNGGPDPKHNFLRHIQIGVGGPDMEAPIVRSDDHEPVGARLTLSFDGHVPSVTGAEVKALLAPLISFDVKTPVQAFTDTLPRPLKDAILNHHVMVGMTTDMVLFAKGQPQSKSREMEGQMPFEEWIYGQPPAEVDFVRINGNRVIRLEVAKMGEKPTIFTDDVVSAMLRTDGTPVVAPETKTRTIAEGDVERDPDRQAPAPAPSLRKPGETLPDHPENGTTDRVGVLRPVQFPKQKPDAQPGANPDEEPTAAPAQSTTQPATTQPAPAEGSQTTPAKSQNLMPATSP